MDSDVKIAAEALAKHCADDPGYADEYHEEAAAVVRALREAGRLPYEVTVTATATEPATSGTCMGCGGPWPDEQLTPCACGSRQRLRLRAEAAPDCTITFEVLPPPPEER